MKFTKTATHHMKMKPPYFSKDFLSFFENLSVNNTTEWFKANKNNYELHVKKPFEIFMADVIEVMKKHDKSISMTAKESIFRINRDTRFSKDKLPYKTNMSGAVSAGGKNPAFPGLYLEASHEGITMLGGAYLIEKENLLKLRKYIAANLKSFQKLINNRKFVTHFNKMEGEKNKLIPNEFKEVVEKEPLIANKQFYFNAKLPAKLVTDKKLMKTIEEYYLVTKPLNNFLMKGLF